METTTKQPETLETACAALGLTYTADFVPFSKSRNAKKATKPGDYSLNWKVTIAKGSRSLTTDYMQGIAHIPGHKQNTRYTSMAWEDLKFTCEQGKTAGKEGSVTRIGSKPIPAPLLRDVLYSLALDAGALDYATFEDWASDFGYEKDSRSAEKTYQACLKIALELRAMIGDAGLQSLRDACQDY